MKNKNGFTLIELVLVLALIGIVLSMIFSPIIFSFKNFNIQNEKTNVISDARTTMDYLTREIRKADLVEVVNGNLTDGGSLIIDSKIYNLDDRILYYNLDYKILYKDSVKVIEGIDEINLNQHESEINILISVNYNIDKEYKLSSDIYLR